MVRPPRRSQRTALSWRREGVPVGRVGIANLKGMIDGAQGHLRSRPMRKRSDGRRTTHERSWGWANGSSLDPKRRNHAGARQPGGYPGEREGPHSARMRAGAVLVKAEIGPVGIADAETGIDTVGMTVPGSPGCGALDNMTRIRRGLDNKRHQSRQKQYRHSTPPWRIEHRYR